MDNLLQEVDQALRAERMGALWRQYRIPLIVVAAALVLGVAAQNAWQHWREAKGGEMLEKLTAAQRLLETGKPLDAATEFGAIADGASGEFQDLALVWQSRSLLNAGKKPEAIAALSKAVADGSSSLWTDVACLRLAGLDATAAEGCLNAKVASPLKATRAEWAAAGLWAKGEQEAAIALTENLIADKNTSGDVRERLILWLSSMKAQRTKAGA